MEKFMKKSFIFALLCILLFTAAVSAAPQVSEQIDLIAANAELWKQDVEFGLWGFTVTDLDHNGRLEIISASVQGTGFYTYIKAFEVNEEGSALNDIYSGNNNKGNSAPDIMVSTVPFYFDKESGIYHYIFDDYIRNGMAENYQNKRAVSLTDGKWEETPLASMTTIYTDAEHYTITCTDADGAPISEAEYDSIADKVFGNLEQNEAEFDWQMTDNDEFSVLTTQQIKDKLNNVSNL